MESGSHISCLKLAIINSPKDNSLLELSKSLNIKTYCGTVFIALRDSI